MENNMSDRVEVQIAEMRNDISYMKETMNKISDALIKLTLMEERQTNQGVVVERLYARLESLEQARHENEISKNKVTELVERTTSVEKSVEVLENKELVFSTKLDTYVKTVNWFWGIYGASIVAAFGKLMGWY